MANPQNMAGVDLTVARRIKKDTSGVAKALHPAVVTNAAATGAVALDLSLGNIFDLTLTGNITSLTLTNAPANPSLVSIHFTQGGAGSFTVTLGASIKTTAGTFVPTTTVGKRSTLLLNQIAGVGYEMGRALNI